MEPIQYEKKGGVPPVLQKTNEVYGHPKSHWHVSLIGGMILVIALFGGATAFMFLNDDFDETSDKPQDKKDSPAAYSQTPPAIPKNTIDLSEERIEPASDVICARFTNVENALEYAEQACVLDLSGQGLTEIPEGTYDLTNLTEINLSNNKLSKFPTQLLGIKSLVTIDLGDNDISSIPGTTTLPDTLQLLNLSENPLSQETIEKYKRTPDNAPLPVVSDNAIKVRK